MSLGVEHSLFLAGLVPAADFCERAANLARTDFDRLGRELNAFLTDAVAAVRPAFGGSLTYSSGTWEDVDWEPFDLVGVDLYRDASNEATYRAGRARAAPSRQARRDHRVRVLLLRRRRRPGRRRVHHRRLVRARARGHREPCTRRAGAGRLPRRAARRVRGRAASTAPSSGTSSSPTARTPPTRGATSTWPGSPWCAATTTTRQLDAGRQRRGTTLWPVATGHDDAHIPPPVERWSASNRLVRMVALSPFNHVLPPPRRAERADQLWMTRARAERLSPHQVAVTMVSEHPPCERRCRCDGCGSSVSTCSSPAGTCRAALGPVLAPAASLRDSCDDWRQRGVVALCFDRLVERSSGGQVTFHLVGQSLMVG